MEGIGFSLQLADYEIRSADHPENAAVKYTLRLVNTSPNPARVELALDEIKGIDNTGAQYADYYALANQFAESNCSVAPNAPKYVMNLVIQVPASGVKQFDFYLNRVGIEGSCADQGAGRSRVDPGAQFMDIQVGKIAYTGDGPRELPSAWWRLAR